MERASRGAGHMVQLDGLRALAAIAIVLQHSVIVRYNWTGFRGVLSDWQPMVGVRLFFVLSGFLITGLLLRARDRVDESPGRLGRAFGIFYARRTLRIFPLYYAVLFGAAILGLPEVRRAFAWHFFYLSNVHVSWLGRFPANLGHFWSLAVEEQFYLIWPTFVLLVPRRIMMPAFLGLFALGNLAYFAVQRLGFAWTDALVLTPVNVDALVIGAALALIHHGGDFARADRLGRWALAAGLGLAALAVALLCWGRGWALAKTCNHASNALIFAWMIHRSARGFGGLTGRLLGSGPLTYLGAISYGIYVYHLIIPEVVARVAGALGRPTPWPHGSAWLDFACAMIASVAVASLSWFAFEKPLNDLKRFFPYEAQAGPRRGAVAPLLSDRPAVGQGSSA